VRRNNYNRAIGKANPQNQAGFEKQTAAERGWQGGKKNLISKGCLF